MNKIAKRFMLLCLLVLVGVGAFSLGRNTTSVNSIINADNNSTSGDVELDYNKINNNIKSLIDRIDKEYLNDYNLQDIEDGIYKGIMQSLNDPYSVYYNEKEFKQLNEHTSGEFGGIGVQVSASSGDLIEVIAPIKGTPGEKAGILPGDKIVKIEGETYFAKDLDKAVSIMRGEPGTNVNITIQRGEGSDLETIDLEITRAIIEVDSVYTKLLYDNIGYLQITGFQERTDEEFKKSLEDLKSQGAKKLILDLRNNPGGLLNVTMNIANVLMDNKVVINVKNKKGDEQVLKTSSGGSDDIPMVVLINKGSASASEVLSGALQDNQRAIIIGETSFGKGVIQNVYPLDNNGLNEGLKITTAQFFTPNNNKIHEVGITPDFQVPIKEGVTKIGVEHIEDDAQLEKAIELLK